MATAENMENQIDSEMSFASALEDYLNPDMGDLEEGSIVKGEVVRVDDDTLARRRAAWTAPAPKETTGWLARYAKLVSGANEGAVMQK